MGSLGLPSVPFLTAAIAALVLYRGMISVLGLDNGAIFTISVATAALLAAAWLMTQLFWPLRKE
jgi:hypothetical protein